MVQCRQNSFMKMNLLLPGILAGILLSSQNNCLAHSLAPAPRPLSFYHLPLARCHHRCNYLSTQKRSPSLHYNFFARSLAPRLFLSFCVEIAEKDRGRYVPRRTSSPLLEMNNGDHSGRGRVDGEGAEGEHTRTWPVCIFSDFSVLGIASHDFGG